MYSKTKLPIYISIFIIGIILCITAIIISPSILQTIVVSLGTGFIAGSLTAGLIDFTSYLDFQKKKKYRRTVELHHLTFEMLTIARLITNQHQSKDIKLLSSKLIGFVLNEENKADIIGILNSARKRIEKDLNTMRTIQDYLSLSGFFSDKEVVFLCRSINLYQREVNDANAQYIFENVSEYLRMFKDTL